MQAIFLFMPELFFVKEQKLVEKIQAAQNSMDEISTHLISKMQTPREPRALLRSTLAVCPGT